VPSEPHTLIVLLQNQLVTIDLTNEKYPEIVAPHLMYLFTPVTSFELFEDVPEDLIRQLQDVDKKPSDVRPFGGYIPKYSQRVRKEMVMSGRNLW
jgi:LLGL2